MTQTIREQITWQYPVNEDKIAATIATFEALAKFGPNKILDVADAVGVSAGFANHVAELIKAERKANQVRPASEARLDRILRTSNSTGKSISRKFN